MFAITFLTFNPNVIIGSLVMYIALFLHCMYAFARRASMDRNPSLYHTLVVAMFGLLNTILLLVASDTNAGYSSEVLHAGLFFGLTLTPLTWMAGIALFSSIDADKRTIAVKIGHFFTFVQFILVTIVVSFVARYFKQGGGDAYDSLTYSDTYIASVSFNWIFFLMYSGLGIYYRHEATPKVFYSLLVFGALNTVRLITETVFLVQGGDLNLDTYLYILFFFTDFVSTISLYVSIFFWKGFDYD